MTPDRQKIAERNDRFILREGLASVMNETKWREAMSAIEEVMGDSAGYLRFQVKCVRKPKPYWGDCEGTFPHHIPRPYKIIEWLEINPVAVAYREGMEVERRDFTGELMKAFQAKSIPLYRSGAMLRIQGYTRNGLAAG